MSSSAALEVAVMQAVSVAYDIALKPREVALLCQMVENLVVGTPCGVMDQMTAACGEEGRLLALLCQPAELVGTIEVPHDLAIGGLDSGVRHSIGGEAYGDVRVGAFMGSRMIAEIEGLTLRDRAPDGTTQIDDPGWRGYLANLTPAEFERYAAHLPEAIRGAQFLSWFGWTTDSVARVSADRSYAVRVPAAHPVYENDRVKRFAELMSEPAGDRRLELMGELMYQSHATYSACGLGSDETDLLVRLVKETGTKNGSLGPESQEVGAAAPSQ